MRKDEVIFESQCPVFDCDNPEIIHWHHSGCSSIWDLYISNRGILRCENCGEIDEFFNCKFDCGCHDNESNSARFRYPTKLKKILAIIGLLEDNGIYVSDFVQILIEALIKQHRNKYR